MEDEHDQPPFALAFIQQEISFPENLGSEPQGYSAAHEKALVDWAYNQSVANGEVLQFVQEMARRTLAVYDAYIAMQMQLGIPPVFDLEMARTFKRTMGMTHEGILQLQNFAGTKEFSEFMNAVKDLKADTLKNLWKDLIAIKNATGTDAEVQELKQKHPDASKAIDAFFKIPAQLRANDELSFVGADKLALLKEAAYRELRIERTLYPSSYHKRSWKASDHKDRVFTELSQRSGSFATIEFSEERSKKPNTYKAGEISDVLTLLFHVDPNLSHVQNSAQQPNRRAEAFARKQQIPNDAIFRAVMAFTSPQHFFMNEIYKLPTAQFDLLNTILNNRHQFTLHEDPHSVVHTALETGGGQYALFSNRNIRKSKNTEEKERHYQQLEASSATTLSEALLNQSEYEKLTLTNTESSRRPTHLFRGTDIFTVPANLAQLESPDERAKQYMAKVDKHGYQVEAGISGTTSRHFAYAYALGLLQTQQNQSKLLTACIGFMGPVKHHSVFEIATTLKSFNVPFKHELGLLKGLEDFTQTPDFETTINQRAAQINGAHRDAASRQDRASNEDRAINTAARRRQNRRRQNRR